LLADLVARRHTSTSSDGSLTGVDDAQVEHPS